MNTAEIRNMIKTYLSETGTGIFYSTVTAEDNGTDYNG
jgi:hypothetical protein